MYWILGGLGLLGWLLFVRQIRMTSAWIDSDYEQRHMAEGFRLAALENKEACEALTYELALLRSAVFTMPADPDGEPGELDVRA
jgi:hypothetical protein